MKLRNTIIYLIGVPAVGKYTVAKEIGRMTGAKVVDNQLINTPIYSVVGYDGTSTFPFPKGAGAHIEKIRTAVLTVIRDFCPPDDSFVFTNVLDAKDPVDKAIFRRIERLAKHRKAGFFPVWLTCEADVIRQRKNSPERRARLKDIDLTTIEWWLQEFEVFKAQHPNALTLDTSHCEAAQTAQRILEHIEGSDRDAGAAISTGRLNGYEAVSGEFISGRTRSSVGAATAREWAKVLPAGGDVLDLGCGSGAPISQALVDEGLNVYGVDASPSMIAAFRARFPNAPAERSAVEDSQFFGRSFDGVVLWGLMFLLPPDAQANLIHKVAAALKPGGRFMFTAPYQVCEWPDNLTGWRSVSLGAEAYRRIVEAAGLLLYDEAEDEGQNHYYFVRKPDNDEG